MTTMDKLQREREGEEGRKGGGGGQTVNRDTRGALEDRRTGTEREHIQCLGMREREGVCVRVSVKERERIARATLCPTFKSLASRNIPRPLEGHLLPLPPSAPLQS